MAELNGNEKYIYLDTVLPAQPVAIEEIAAGDLMLYGDNCIVLFYESFSTPYSYTRLGGVDDPVGLQEALGDGDAMVSFSVGE